MFIEYVKAKNFGRIKDHRQDYVDGTIVVRGPNGSGKSTFTVQVPLYCFFGSSTLEAPLADTVNEDAKVSGLYTEVKLGPYVTKRSKSSASVVGNGVKISGQAEVSQFWYDFFSIAKGAEEAVLLAKQGETAGILKSGDGKVNSVIEDLAGFYQIDELIERVKQTFPSGNKKILEESLAVLDEEAVRLGEQELPNVVERESGIRVATDILNLVSKQVVDQKTEVDAKNEELAEFNRCNNAIVKADAQFESEEANLKGLNERLKVLDDKEYEQFDLAELGKAKKLVESITEAQRLWTLYNWATSLIDFADYWEGDLASFQEMLKQATQDDKRLSENILQAKHTIQTLTAAFEQEDVCSKCGSDIVAKKEEINKGLQEKLNIAEADLGKYTEEYTDNKEYLTALKAIGAEHNNRHKEVGTEVYVNRDVVPWTYSWVGEVPQKPDQQAVNAATTLLSRFDVEMAAMKVDDAAKLSLVKLINASVSEVTMLTAAREELGQKIDIAHVTEELKAFNTRLAELQEEEKATTTKLSDLTKAYALDRQVIQHWKEAVATNKEAKLATKKKLKTDGRNGKILKNVRDAKPKVLDLVWGNVVKVVTSRSSEMLGREMVVEKGSKGFKVNGRHVARLSGAEKSTTGIALREAIRDVFAPSAGFIFLDEPYSDCDADVKYAAIAAVGAMRGQRFIITHEDSSEMFADQVVMFDRQ